MATIKKAFQPIMSLLAANMSATVEEIYKDVEALTVARVGAGGSNVTTSHRDEEGNIVAVRCSYFQKWFRTDEVEFGKKVGSASGLNPMCKLGVSAWTKQQSEFKKAKEDILAQVISGDVDPEDIAGIIDELEEKRVTIVELPEGITGYDSLEDLLAA
jgi:hypothetical protein